MPGHAKVMLTRVQWWIGCRGLGVCTARAEDRVEALLMI